MSVALPLEGGGVATGVLALDCAEVSEALGPLVDTLSGKRVLITGARGMLPAYLLHAIAHFNRTKLSHNPCRVVALSRRSPDGLLAAYRWVEWLAQDARDPLGDNVHFDYAVCAASAASPRAYLADPVGTLLTNAQGLQVVLERARRCDAKGVLFFSSGEIYGSPPDGACPTPEDYLAPSDPLAPRSCYAGGKRFGESLLMAYVRQYGVRGAIVRPFQIFGPGLRLDDGRAFADFLSAAAVGEPIELRSAGQARRTYCYIADATAAFFKVLLSARPGAVYNVGSSSPEVTILELAKKIAEAGGRGSRVVFSGQGEEGKGSPARTCPDVSRIQKDLGWSPSTSLEEGLRRTLSWLRQGEPV